MQRHVEKCFSPHIFSFKQAKLGRIWTFSVQITIRSRSDHDCERNLDHIFLRNLRWMWTDLRSLISKELIGKRSYFSITFCSNPQINFCFYICLWAFLFWYINSELKYFCFWNVVYNLGFYFWCINSELEFFRFLKGFLRIVKGS